MITILSKKFEITCDGKIYYVSGSMLWTTREEWSVKDVNGESVEDSLKETILKELLNNA